MKVTSFALTAAVAMGMAGAASAATLDPFDPTNVEYFINAVAFDSNGVVYDFTTSLVFAPTPGSIDATFNQTVTATCAEGGIGTTDTATSGYFATSVTYGGTGAQCYYSPNAPYPPSSLDASFTITTDGTGALVGFSYTGEGFGVTDNIFTFADGSSAEAEVFNWSILAVPGGEALAFGEAFAPSPVPLPASASLMLVALAGMGAARRLRRP
jgi:hypothetical protein